MKRICTLQKRNLNFVFFFMISSNSVRVKKNRGSRGCRGQKSLLLPEGLAVSALVHSGIGLMGANQDPVQRTVVLVLAVVCALLDGTFNALVCVTVHALFLLFL